MCSVWRVPCTVLAQQIGREIVVAASFFLICNYSKLSFQVHALAQMSCISNFGGFGLISNSVPHTSR